MTASTLTYNVPSNLTTPFDANKLNANQPVAGQMANGWLDNSDTIKADLGQNYLHNAHTSLLWSMQQLGICLPFNPDGLGHSLVATPKGGIVSLKDSVTGVTQFYVAQNAMAIGYVDPSTDPTNWTYINFPTLAKLVPAYADATGTSDAITAIYTVVYPVLQDGMMLELGIVTPNATSAPTFTPTINGSVQTTRTIFKMVNNTAVPLAAGDLQGVVSLRYDLPNTRWILLNPGSMIAGRAIQGNFKNLQSSATGTTANIVASADEISVEDTNSSYYTIRAVSITINSATTGANGLDTGTLAASTWYSVWVIYNPSTLTTAGLISLSATAPTMPTGYTFKARIGWIRTDGTVNKYPLSFIQYGRSVQYKVAAGSNIVGLPALAAGVAGNISTPTWVAIAIGTFIPSTASKIRIVTFEGTISTGIIVAPNNSYGPAGSTTNPPPIFNASGSSGGQSSSPIDILIESTNIYWASNGAASYVFCMGWEDNI